MQRLIELQEQFDTLTTELKSMETTDYWYRFKWDMRAELRMRIGELKKHIPILK